LAAASRSGYLRRMTTPQNPIYAGYRYPAELISYAVWLYFRFSLSLRIVEEMLGARGISVTYETIRQWGLKFSRELANRIRRRAPRRGDKWHLDEVVITIAGRSIGCGARLTKRASFSMSSSRAGATRRPPSVCTVNCEEAEASARVLITDKLKSYSAAKRQILPGVEHRQHKGLNNRAENSPQPTRRRERIMKRFKSPRQVQQFLAAPTKIPPRSFIPPATKHSSPGPKSPA
jgi:putative transposase